MDIMSVKAKEITFGVVVQGIRQNTPYNQFWFFCLLVLVWAFALYAYCENLGEKVRILMFLIRVLSPWEIFWSQYYGGVGRNSIDVHKLAKASSCY